MAETQKRSFTNAEYLQQLIDPMRPSFDQNISPEAIKFFAENKLVIGADEYRQQRYKMFNDLVERIGLTTVNSLETVNPLSIFDESEGFLLGDTIQEIGTDVIDGYEYQGLENPQDQFAPKIPKVNAAYHKINRQYQYQTTLGDATITRAFITEGGIDNLFGQFVKRLYDSNTRDKFLYFKKCLADIVSGKSGIPLLPSQIVEIPDLRDETLSPEMSRRAILRVKNTVSQMALNYKGFNQLEYTQAVGKGDLASVICFQAKNQNITQNLPLLYTPSFSVVDIEREVEVDDFADNGDIIWGIFDRRFLQCRRNKQTLTNAENAKSLYVNYFFTIFEIYYQSPFRSAVFFVKEGSKAGILKRNNEMAKKIQKARADLL